MLWYKNFTYTLVVPCTVAIYVPWLLVGEQAANSGIWLFLAAVLFVLGGAVYSWCLWGFATLGQGTPAPFDPPTHLVVQGPYHYTRNPMYVAVMTFIFGCIALFPFTPLLLYGLSVAVCIHLFVIFYEEPHLKKIFGTSYDEYRTRVGRWIPTLSKKTSQNKPEKDQLKLIH